MKVVTSVLLSFLFLNLYANDVSDAETITGGSKDADVQLIYYYLADTVVNYFYNEKTETICWIDYINKVVTFLDGKTGAAFVFQVTQRRGVYIPARSSNQTWLSSKEKFEVYYKRFQIVELYPVGQKFGLEFNSETINRDTEKKLTKLLLTFSISYSEECRSVSNALESSAKVLTFNAGAWKDYLNDAQAPIPQDLHQVLGVFDGIGLFLAQLQGLQQGLISKEVVYDDSQILAKDSGIQCVIVLMKQSSKLDLGTSLSNTFNSDSLLFELFALSSGSVEYGYPGFLLSLSKCVDAASGVLSEENFHRVLLLFVGSKRLCKVDVGRNFVKDIDDFEGIIKDLNLTTAFKGTTKTIRAIKEQNWIIENYNVSLAIDIIAKVERPANAAAKQKLLIDLEKCKDQQKGE